jgi:hypothetical protein
MATIDPTKALLGKLTYSYQEAADYAQRDRNELDLKLRFFRSIHHAPKRRRRSADYSLFEEQPDDRVAFETIPLIRPTIRQAVALFLADLPRLSIIPRGSGVVQRKQAQLAERFVNGMTTCYPQLYEALYEAKLGAEVFGGHWLKTFWDPFDFEDGATPEGTPKGNVAWLALSRLDVFRDPRAQNPRKVRYVHHRKVMPLGQALEHYPVDIFDEEMKPGDFTILGAKHPNPLSEMQSSQFSTSKTNENDLVEIIETWVQKSPKYPNGGFIMFTGGRILALPLAEMQSPEMTEESASSISLAGALPLSLPDGYWPWTYIRGLNKVPGKFDSDGLLNDLIPLQVTINHYMSRIREGVNLSSQTFWTASREGNVNVEHMDSMDGSILMHDGMFAPSYVQGPGPHQGTMLALDKALEIFNGVSTQPEAARGLTNGQANAKLLAVQQELGRTIHSPDVSMMANGEVAQIYKQTLSCVSANYTPDRFVRMLGANDQPVVHLFDPAIFDPNIGMVFIPGQAPPQSRELQEAKIMEGMAAGLFGDDAAAMRARSKIRWLRDSDEALDPKPAHTERAEMEQVLTMPTPEFPEGIPPTLLGADDDNIHLTHHEPFIISAEFLSLTPQMQQFWQDHVAGHQMQLAIKEGQYAQSASMLGGGGAGGPGGAQAGGPPGSDGRGAESPQDGGSGLAPDASTADVPPAPLMTS